ncbi:MAG: hypothetical protein LBQ68_01450 [Clostridiales bacterium]|jgi:medium-chain acyl-[acyl-carrier-protein] hydrolase|nr:hypothetical protein [Clostridiales bacterium]
MGKFQCTFNIDYQALNEDFTATLPRLMHFVQESSIRQTDSTTLPMKWYYENGLAWVVTNWSVKVSRYPKRCENIIVSTYPTKFKGVIGERWFEAEDENGKRILLAFSSWMLADLKNAKLVRPTPEIIASYGLHPEPEDKKSFFPGLNTAGQLPINTRKFIVTRRELDTNNHVNNVKYMEWAFDDVPDDLYYTSKPDELKAVYRKQCAKDDVILAEFYQDKENPLLCASVFRNPTDKTIFSEIHSLWKPR